MWWQGSPKNIFKRKTKQKANYVSFYREIYGRFRISLNNYKFTKFRDFASDFASWSQNRVRVKLVKISKFAFDIMVLNLDQLDNKLSEISKLIKLNFIFIRRMTEKAGPYRVKVPINLNAFDRLVYREIELITLTLMTSIKTQAPELRMITRDFY